MCFGSGQTTSPQGLWPPTYMHLMVFKAEERPDHSRKSWRDYDEDFIGLQHD